MPTAGNLYMLDENGDAFETTDPSGWETWFKQSAQQRIVAQDTVGVAQISTVFLAVNHNFSGGVPLLWETMVFGGTMDGETERYTDKEAAINGHKVMCSAVTEAC